MNSPPVCNQKLAFRPTPGRQSPKAVAVASRMKGSEGSPDDYRSVFFETVGLLCVFLQKKSSN